MTPLMDLTAADLRKLTPKGLADVRNRAIQGFTIIANQNVISFGADQIMKRHRSVQYAVDREIAARLKATTDIES